MRFRVGVHGRSKRAAKPQALDAQILLDKCELFANGDFRRVELLQSQSQEVTQRVDGVSGPGTVAFPNQGRDTVQSIE